MARLAVVMPAYNAARTLERTVNSVLDQTFSDFELWIVDDGSTDDTGKIADQCARKDARIHVMHQTNTKAYQARVNALRKITAPYIGFIDADDFVDSTMYEKLMEFIKKYDLEVAQCGIVGECQLDTPELFLNRESVVDNVVTPYLVEGKGSLFVWDKIYKSALAEGLEDSHIMMFDDMKLNLHFLRSVTRYGRLNEGLYHYDINTGSSVKNFRSGNVEDFREIISTRRAELRSYGIPDGDIVHDRWIVMNARNMIISAACAPAESWQKKSGKCALGVRPWGV